MARVLPILWLIFVIGVLYNIWKSPYHSLDKKLLWMGVVFFFPGIGIILWMIYGQR